MSMREEYVRLELLRTEIEESKDLRREKDRLLGKGIDLSPKRWTGEAGELAFKLWLEQHDLPFTHNLEINKAPFDFLVKNTRIDVKTLACNTFPQEHYGVQVRQDQIKNDVDAYLFCRFLNGTAYLVGWLDKETFLRKAVKLEIGERLTKYFTVREPMYEVLISDLEPLETLIAYVG